MNREKVYPISLSPRRILISALTILMSLVLLFPSPTLAQGLPAHAQQGGTVPIYMPVMMSESSSTAEEPGPTVTILAAGDIANGANATVDGTCGGPAAGLTAGLLGNYPTSASILTIGDHVYPDGSADQYRICFTPSWGQYKSRIYPTPGNHDYFTPGAAGYFGYFGSVAGDPGKGWYSFDLGSWHIISLNSNCWTDTNDAPVSCAAGSEQETWLKADLAAHTNKCSLAFFHHPLFTSSVDGPSTWIQNLWQTLYTGGVDVVLNGHASLYERFNPQKPDGSPDPKGIVEFAVGTGGIDLDTMSPAPIANEAARTNEHHGILKMELSGSSYIYEFVPIAGEAGAAFTDTGFGACH